MESFKIAYMILDRIQLGNTDLDDQSVAKIRPSQTQRCGEGICFGKESVLLTEDSFLRPWYEFWE